MKTKTLAVLGIVVLLTVAALIGTFLLRTSTEIEKKTAESQNQTPENPSEELRSVMTLDDESNRTVMDPGQADPLPAISVNGSQEPHVNVPVTPYFVTDMADYILSHYHPGGSLTNPGDQGFTSLTFKQLNMHYGLDLIGLRHRSPEKHDARDEIMDRLLRTDVVNAVQALYGQAFLDELLSRAGQVRKTFSSPGAEPEQRPLSEAQISEMLQLNASYLEECSIVLKQLATSPQLDTTVQRLFILEQAATQANAHFSQARHTFELLRRKTQDRQSDFSDVPGLQEAQQAMEDAGSAYKTAIKAREEAKQEVLGLVSEAGRSRLNDSEILYMAKWVYRRLGQTGQSREALVQAASHLEDLAGRMKEMQP